MIYFDNAATGGFKPDIVKQNTYNAAFLSPVNVGRTAACFSENADNLIYNTRAFLSKTINNGLIGKVIFTPSCTYALNAAVFGSKICGTEIVTTVTEHNSVLRPLKRLSYVCGLTLKFAEPDFNGVVKAESVLNLVTENTAMVVMNAVSNVTGAKNEFEKVGNGLNKNIPFIVDGAQAGGHINFDMKRDNISALALAGHKGLYAMQGVGVLLLNENFDITPTVFGGSGSETFEDVPSSYPEKLEAGTQNFAAISSLYFGAKYAYEYLDYNNFRLKSLTNRLIGGLLCYDGIKVYSSPNIYGIASFEVKNCPSMMLGDVLAKKYDIATRSGFHCAPLMHKHLKTSDNGLIRLSLSPFNNEKEIDYFLSVLPKAVSSLFEV